MHLRSASMPSQQQQTGVLESIEPPFAPPRMEFGNITKSFG